MKQQNFYTEPMTSLYFHPDCLLHNPGPDPTYAPARINTIIDRLRMMEGLNWPNCKPASPNFLKLAHTQNHIDSILGFIPENEFRLFEKDTIATHGTTAAILASAGAVLTATKDVASEKTKNAFCLASPGGHHAEADMALGFCFANHIALAALYAQQMGFKRVAVIDIDAHHGNGTQNIFWNYPDRFYISLHEANDLSGFADETGVQNNIFNIPVPHHSAGEDYLRIFVDKVEPALTVFQPDFIFVSAGFDAHREDPLARLGLETTDYDRLGNRLAALADNLCGGKLVALLEGGYNLDYLGDCVAAFVTGMNQYER